MIKIIQVAYTNHNCKDVLLPFLKQNKKFTKLPLYLISNYDVSSLIETDYYHYDESDSYYSVWNNALKKFNSEYFIYLQEDFYLKSKVDEDRIMEYVQFLEDNKEYSFVRLAKCITFGNNKITDTLFELESTNQNVFAMQSTIWRTSDYIELMERVREPKWLETPNYRNEIIKMNMKGLYHFDNEKQIGRSHWDSNIYPYIATAVVRGQWNYREYANELDSILKENNIDVNNRGKFLN